MEAWPGAAAAPAARDGLPHGNKMLGQRVVLDAADRARLPVQFRCTHMQTHTYTEIVADGRRKDIEMYIQASRYTPSLMKSTKIRAV